MTRCTRASYDDKAAATTARRKLLRKFGDSAQRAPVLAVLYCEDCDRYHIVADKAKYFNERAIRILQYMAQGFRDAEIANIMDLTVDKIDWSVRSMLKRFNALSRTHLMAIAISLGLVNPNDFVPEHDERQHA